VKELKVLRATSEKVCLPRLWNPVKELKEHLDDLALRRGKILWNPVKELKGNIALLLSRTVVIANHAAVESGEGIERQHRAPGRCVRPSA